MKKIIIVLFMINSVFAWEINTHRAIDRKALEKSENLQAFIDNANIDNTNYINQKFEGYDNDITYINYLLYGEENGVSADKWNQYFNELNADYQDLIEAGSILEDAVYKDADWYAFGGDGRFNNHFYDAQNNGHSLTAGYGLRVNALKWAVAGARDILGEKENVYTYYKALSYFKKSFTESNPEVRKKYQAKMLVGVGHLLHLMNDMKEEI